MTPQVIVHQPIPHDLGPLLNNLGYLPAAAAESHTRFVWVPNRVHRRPLIDAKTPAEASHDLYA